MGQAQWLARRVRRPSRIMVAAGVAVLVASTGTAAAGTAFAGTAARAAAHPAALPSGAAPSAARGSGVPRPQVIGPITGGTHGRPFTSSPVPLGRPGIASKSSF